MFNQILSAGYVECRIQRIGENKENFILNRHLLYRQPFSQMMQNELVWFFIFVKR